jgi:hypothetical protein
VKVFAVGIAASIALASPAKSETEVQALLKGDKFYDACILNQKSANRYFCGGYVMGVADTLSISNYDVCPPQNITGAELLIAMRAYFVKHREVRGYAAASIVRAAIKDSFPC